MTIHGAKRATTDRERTFGRFIRGLVRHHEQTRNSAGPENGGFPSQSKRINVRRALGLGARERIDGGGLLEPHQCVELPG